MILWPAPSTRAPPARAEPLPVQSIKQPQLDLHSRLHKPGTCNETWGPSQAGGSAGGAGCGLSAGEVPKRSDSGVLRGGAAGGWRWAHVGGRQERYLVAEPGEGLLMVAG